MTEFRTYGRGLLLDLMDTSATFSQERLDGLSDEEILWEPVSPCWSVRRRGETALAAHGPGDFVMESEPEKEAFTTIAWRVAHLTTGFAARWEWSFGSRSVAVEDVVDFAATADRGLEQLWSAFARWREGIAHMDEENFLQVGYSQMPDGLDPTVPFASIVWWQSREMVHHLAEIALLRDLFAARP